jgi:hypothetical protein
MTGESDPVTETIITAILQGVPPDPELAAQIGDRELLARFRRLLTEQPATGRTRLAEAVGQDGGRVGDLAVEALGRWGGREAGPLLAQVDPDRCGRSRRKALRRALHSYESAHGIAASRPEVPATKDAPAERNGAFINAPSGLGGRVWLFRRESGSDRSGRFAVVIVSDRRGVRDFGWQDGREASFERYRKRLEQQSIFLAEVPWAFLQHRLRETERINGERGEPLPPNYVVLREWLELDSPGDEPPPHPGRLDESILEVRNPPSPAEVRGLLELPETHDWMLPPDAFEGQQKELEAAGKSQLVLDGLDPRERIHKILATVLENYMSAEERGIWGARLLDLSLVLHHSNRARSARLAALLAADLTATDRSPVSDAYLWALASRTLGLVQSGADLSASDPQEPGPPADQGESGLILP